MSAAARKWVGEALGNDGVSRLVTISVTGLGQVEDSDIERLRRLLLDEETWSRVAGGDTNDIEMLIASCLPPTGSRSQADCQVMANLITRNLLGFQLGELDEAQFRAYLAGLFDHLQAEVLTTVDEAFLQTHSDMVMAHAQSRKSYRRLFGFLRDRLPPKPAGPDVLSLYLVALIAKLDDDPWPVEQYPEANAPRPSEIERRMILRYGDGEDSADRIAGESQRLVVLGGPGSGKTWFAKRTARRCAIAALEQLRDKRPVSDIEIPVYTTCTHFSEEAGSVRRALFGAALRSLPDLGAHDLADAVGRLLDSHQRALVVLDSLDEALSIESSRLRDAATIDGWRLLLTTRPSSWHNQLRIDKDNSGHRLGELLELSYPEDVEAIIDSWLPADAASRLKRHLGNRPSRAQAAKVPLIAALYCIVGTDRELPSLRRELYRTATVKLLQGRWRGSTPAEVDVDAAEKDLRTWASEGLLDTAVADGSLPELVVVSPSKSLSAADHICPVVAWVGNDRLRERRFIHQTFREHFAAEHIATMSIDKAEECLRPHIWFDPSWERVVPAAIAAHPDGLVLASRLLLGSERFPDMLGELDRHMAALAAETSPHEWKTLGADILQSRLNRVGTGSSLATLWQRHDDEVWNAELRQLDRDSPSPAAVVRLSRNEAQRTATASDLLKSLETQPESSLDRDLITGVVHLVGSDERRDIALDLLLSRLKARNSRELDRELIVGVVQLANNERRERKTLGVLATRLEDESRERITQDLVRGVVRLATSERPRQDALNGVLHVLGTKKNERGTGGLVRGALQLATSEQERTQVYDALTERIETEESEWATSKLMSGLLDLEKTKLQRLDSLELSKRLLEKQTNEWTAELLVGAILDLVESAGERRDALEFLLGCLNSTAGVWLAGPLAYGVDQLGVGNTERRVAFNALKSRFERETDVWIAGALVKGIVELVGAEWQRKAALALFHNKLEAEVNAELSRDLIEGIRQLAKTDEQRLAAVAVLTERIEAETNAALTRKLARGLVQLAESSQERLQAIEVLQARLDGETNGWVVRGLVGGMVEVAESHELCRVVGDILIGRLTERTNSRQTGVLLKGLVQLSESGIRRSHIFELVKERLDDEVDPELFRDSIDGIVRLAGSEKERQDAIDSLTIRLESATNPGMARQIVGGLVGLQVTPSWLIKNRYIVPADLWMPLVRSTRHSTSWTRWSSDLPELAGCCP